MKPVLRNVDSSPILKGGLSQRFCHVLGGLKGSSSLFIALYGIDIHEQEITAKAKGIKNRIFVNMYSRSDFMSINCRACLRYLHGHIRNQHVVVLQAVKSLIMHSSVMLLRKVIHIFNFLSRVAHGCHPVRAFSRCYTNTGTNARFMLILA